MPKPLAFAYSVYYENYLDEDSSETLKQWTKDSAYEAVTDCLDPKVRADFLEVECRERDHVLYGDFSPYATWKTLEAFQEQLRLLREAHRIQRGEVLSLDTATHRLIITAIETKRLS